MGKFQYMTELSAPDMSIFLFQDNNLSKSQWIFTKLDMCIYIVEICFWIANTKLSLFFLVICLQHNNSGVLSFHDFIGHEFSLQANYLRTKQNRTKYFHLK